MLLTAESMNPLGVALEIIKTAGLVIRQATNLPEWSGPKTDGVRGSICLYLYPQRMVVLHANLSLLRTEELQQLAMNHMNMSMENALTLAGHIRAVEQIPTLRSLTPEELGCYGLLFNGAVRLDQSLLFSYWGQRDSQLNEAVAVAIAYFRGMLELNQLNLIRRVNHNPLINRLLALCLKTATQ